MISSLIPGGMQAKALAALVVTAVVFSVGFGLAWKLQGANIAALKETYAEQAAKAAAAALVQQQALEQQVSALDTTYAKALVDERSQNEKLRAAVADGTRRLRIHAACPVGVPAGAASAGGDHAAPGWANVDPADAQRLLDLAATGDHWRGQLMACQAYVTTIRKGTKQ